jgi:predicted RNA-binding Zn-ribbon protein involved in translation (DUF1610 family)
MNVFSFDDFKRRYPDDESCRKRLVEIVWPDGFKCPKCGAAEYDYLQARKLYQCKKCRRQTSITAGIKMLHGSHLPLHKWFWAIFILSTNFNTKSIELKRELDVPYQTVSNIKLKARPVITIELPQRKRERELVAVIAGVELSNLGKSVSEAESK